MYLTGQTLITLAAVLAAVAALVNYFTRAHNWYLRQETNEKNIAAIQAEQKVLVKGVLACLKGLQEQGCDGPVADAITQLENHLNEEAHK
jgi:hypothetical protein